MNAAFKTAIKGDFKTLKSLLESEDKDQLFSFVGWEKYNVLHAAVLANNVQCVRLIVDAFPLLTEQVNYKQRTPLHLACHIRADLNIIKVLSEFKNTINIKNSYGQTALFEALVMEGYAADGKNATSLEIIEILIEKGANVHVRGRIGFTVLHEAVFCDQFEEFEVLLNHGVKIDLQDYLGRTVLCVAAIKNKCEFLKIILEKDPKLVNILDDAMNSPLLHTLQHDCANCIELLIKNNANAVLTNKIGQSCIEIAIKSGNRKIVAKLLEIGADPSIYSAKMCLIPPFLFACVKNYVSVIDLLINHESINNYVINAKKFEHPLVAAIKNENPNLLKLLLKHPPFLDKSLMVDFPIKEFLLCSGVIGYLLYISFKKVRPFTCKFYNVLKCFELLLQENFHLNHSDNESVSAITSLFLPFSANDTHNTILYILERLVEFECDVHEISISNEICEEYLIDIEIRNELQVPDALVMAFASENVLATKYLLKYWPQPPILLILLCPIKSLDEILKWFKILIKFGWPTGNKFSRQLEDLIDVDNEENEIATLDQNPCSLQCLAKFAARNYLFGRKSEFGMSLPTLIESLYFPPLLRDELLLVDPMVVAEDEISNNEESGDDMDDEESDESMELGEYSD